MPTSRVGRWSGETLRSRGRPTSGGRHGSVRGSDPCISGPGFAELPRPATLAASRRFEPACGRRASRRSGLPEQIRLKRSGKGPPDTNPVSDKQAGFFVGEESSMPSFAATTGGGSERAAAGRSVGAVVARRARFELPLPLACGRTLPLFDLAYETYGTLNARRSNAVLVLPRAQRLAPRRRLLRRRPAQRRLVGQHDRAGQAARHRPLLRRRREQPRRLLRLDRARVASIPRPARPGARDFPLVTVEDWVDAQARLADRLGIERCAAVMGGSLGAMQALRGRRAIRGASATRW